MPTVPTPNPTPRADLLSRLHRLSTAIDVRLDEVTQELSHVPDETALAAWMHDLLFVTQQAAVLAKALHADLKASGAYGHEACDEYPDEHPALASVGARGL